MTTPRQGDRPCRCFSPSPWLAAHGAGTPTVPCSGLPWWTGSPHFSLAHAPTASPAGVGTPLKPAPSFKEARFAFTTHLKVLCKTIKPLYKM